MVALPMLSGFHHVKLPVGDVVRSRDWYQAILGLAVDIEFVEDGVLMGVALRDPTGTVSLAARHDPQRAAALPASTSSPWASRPAVTWRRGCPGSTPSASRTAGS